MIGNDIVDLQCAGKESNWQRPGFLQKVFTSSEVALIHHTENPEQITWLLWSLKESVYKIISRQENRCFFAPKKIICHLSNLALKKPLNHLSASVSYENQSFKTESFITKKYIHTVAKAVNSSVQLQVGFHYINDRSYQNQRQQVREKLIEHYTANARSGLKYFSICKDDLGIPQLNFKNQKQATKISLSHHGHYVGFAYTT